MPRRVPTRRGVSGGGYPPPAQPGPRRFVAISGQFWPKSSKNRVFLRKNRIFALGWAQNGKKTGFLAKKHVFYQKNRFFSKKTGFFDKNGLNLALARPGRAPGPGPGLGPPGPWVFLGPQAQERPRGPRGGPGGPPGPGPGGSPGPCKNPEGNPRENARKVHFARVPPYKMGPRGPFLRGFLGLGLGPRAGLGARTWPPGPGRGHFWPFLRPRGLSRGQKRPQMPLFLGVPGPHKNRLSGPWTGPDTGFLGSGEASGAQKTRFFAKKPVF